MHTRSARPSDAEITRLVHTFYERVREDPLLAPVFEPRIGDNWAVHLDRMVAFWSSVLLGKPGFVGDPIGKHRAIAELEPRHFDRWLALFEQVLGELFPPLVAADIHGRAVRMRVALEGRVPAVPNGPLGS